MPKDETLSFTVAASRFFFRKGQDKITDFVQELKSLTIVDKKELAPLLAEALDVKEIEVEGVIFKAPSIVS